MNNKPHDEAMAELFKEDPAYAVDLLNSILVLQLQIAVTEGAGGFNPLKTGPNIEAFRPGFKPLEASTTVVLEDGEQGELLIALRQMTKAFGGVQDIAERANLNPTQPGGPLN